ncbi:multiubiquitin domain-containing protein [Bradyrhizobium sp. 147]|nr:multiubiquitin domain-containing protein [Bradyrhizobium sp. 147]
MPVESRSRIAWRPCCAPGSKLARRKPNQVEKKHITYAQVVELYLGSGGSPSNEYLVKYSHGPAENPSGTLDPGQKVAAKDGMRFRVAGTGES